MAVENVFIITVINPMTFTPIILPDLPKMRKRPDMSMSVWKVLDFDFWIEMWTRQSTVRNKRSCSGIQTNNNQLLSEGELGTRKRNKRNTCSTPQMPTVSGN